MVSTHFDDQFFTTHSPGPLQNIVNSKVTKVFAGGTPATFGIEEAFGCVETRQNTGSMSPEYTTPTWVLFPPSPLGSVCGKVKGCCLLGVVNPHLRSASYHRDIDSEARARAGGLGGQDGTINIMTEPRVSLGLEETILRPKSMSTSRLVERG